MEYHTSESLRLYRIEALLGELQRRVI